MKLYYLKEVQVLLDNYDFQDKYKILLDLENYITKQEEKGINDTEVLISKLGTPEQFVERVAKKYNLIPVDDNLSKSDIDGNTEELLSENNLQAQDFEHTENITLEMQPINDEEQVVERFEQDYDVKDTKQPFDNPAKKPFAILFKIVSTIFYIASLIVVASAIVVSIAMLLLIDVQTAISFFLGIILAITAGILTLSSIKNFVYGILDNDLKIGTIVIKVIVIVLCVIISNTLVSTSLDKITIYVTSNLAAVQELLNGLNIDIYEVDWQNLDLSDYTELAIDIVKSYLMG